MKESLDSLGLSRLHDAELISILHVDHHEVAITFETVAKQRVKLELSGLVDLYIRDLRQQNVVMDVSVQNVDEASIEAIVAELDHASNGQAPSINTTQLKHLASIGNLKFVCLEPSTGCIVYALCTKIELTACS
ncbi:hypothetical protein [Kordiimonas marina]|uniref:hypothetical protein n=1 Tax=Kordiimonas marina TaxID=2872312 RepID=UPI001FF5EB25|nr:hypothetical protein [Kordiimonas marina]MCJ9427909.1 hypothetical protein [Kordiimonas marina]